MRKGKHEKQGLSKDEDKKKSSKLALCNSCYSFNFSRYAKCLN